MAARLVLGHWHAQLPQQPPQPPIVAGGAPQLPQVPPSQVQPVSGQPVPIAAAGVPPPSSSIVAQMMPQLPHVQPLLRLLHRAELSMLGQLDALVHALAPNGVPPSDALNPPGDVFARLEYANERVGEILSSIGMASVPEVLAAGWPGVFGCVRSMNRLLRQAAPAAAQADLSSSFGRAADRHRAAQLMTLAGAAGSSAGLPQASTQTPAGQALLSAGISIDREGMQPASAQPMLSAVHAASTILASDVPSVQNLGGRLASLPPAVQIIESADGVAFSAHSITP